MVAEMSDAVSWRKPGPMMWILADLAVHIDERRLLADPVASRLIRTTPLCPRPHQLNYGIANASAISSISTTKRNAIVAAR